MAFNGRMLYFLPLLVVAVSLETFAYTVLYTGVTGGKDQTSGGCSLC